MLDGFVCNTMLDLLKRPKETHRKVRLLLESIREDLEQCKDRVESLEKCLQSAVGRMQSAVQAFLCLLSPDCSHFASDVNNLQKYKGKDPLETLVSQIVQKNEFYKAAWDEELSKGTATLACQKPMQELVARLDDEGTCLEALPDALEALAKFRKQARAGATAALENKLHEKLMDIAKSLSGDGIQGRTMSFINTVLKGLHMFADRSGVLSIAAKVEKARVQALSSLAMEELRTSLQTYPSTDDDTWPRDLPDLAKTLEALQGCTDLDFNGSLQTLLTNALYWHYKELSTSKLFVSWSEGYQGCRCLFCG